MIRKTLHVLLFSSRLTLLDLSWKFDRSFCRDNASEIELMVLKILVSSQPRTQALYVLIIQLCIRCALATLVTDLYIYNCIRST